MNCRMCNNNALELFLDLGFVPLVDRFLSFEELNHPEKFYPLNVHLCKKCGLAQLGYLVPPKELFNVNYAYESGTTEGRRKNHSKLASYVCKEFKISKNSLIIDIGSNVGILLECFKKEGMKVLGIDASKNVVKIANSKGIQTICGFFDDKLVQKIISDKQKAQVVTATNLFAHIQDYDSFMIALKKLLDENGIFVLQVPHFLQLVKHLEYDTIYHEHVSYFGLKPLITFFKKWDMRIFDVHETDIDGGSIRCFVSYKGKKSISYNVKKILEQEKKEKLYSLERLSRFAKDVKKQKLKLLELLISLKKKNKKIVGVGAAAKGNILLNYCKIDNNILNYVTDKSKLKINKFTPGSHLQVYSDEKLLNDHPDFALILAWNFAKEIIKNLNDYKREGGKFIIPIPMPRIV